MNRAGTSLIPKLRAGVLCALVLFGSALHCVAADTLIVNSRAGIDALSRNEARLYITMRVKQWPNGIPVRVFVLPDNDPLHLRVVKSLLGLFPYQLRRAWDRQLFSGTGQAPVTLENEAELIRRVAETPGGVSYASSTPSHPAVRPLELR